MSSVDDRSPLPLVLDAAGVAHTLGYVRTRGRAGEPNRDLVHKLVRTGKIPSPIDDTLPIRQWRWNREVIEAYVRGEWSPAANPLVGGSF